MKPIVTILEHIHQDGIDVLSDFAEVRISFGLDRRSLLDAISDSDVIIVKSLVQIDAELFDHAPCLKLVGRAGTGLDNFDLDEAANRNVNIFSVPTGNTVTASEFAICQILMLTRRINESIDLVRNNDFRRHMIEGRELKFLSVGLVGLGNVGMAVVERLAPFGCRILGWDPKPKNATRFSQLGGQLTANLDEMLPQVDVLSLHATLNPDNISLISDNEFSLVRKGLLLVNMARAGLIDEQALIRALDNGKVSWAALDVLDPEPPFDLAPNCHDYKHELLKHPRTTITPHIGASTSDAQRAIAINLAEKIRNFFSKHN